MQCLCFSPSFYLKDNENTSYKLRIISRESNYASVTTFIKSNKNVLLKLLFPAPHFQYTVSYESWIYIYSYNWFLQKKWSKEWTVNQGLSNEAKWIFCEDWSKKKNHNMKKKNGLMDLNKLPTKKNQILEN